ncbi:MAG: hypothetical protein ACK5HL_04240 [Bacilli bacterium]
MNKPLTLLIPRKPLTYARYLSLTTGVFIDKRKTKSDYRMIYSLKATEEELSSKNNTILISDHIIHMQKRDEKSFNHSFNKERYSQLLLNLLNSKKDAINFSLVDLDKDNSVYFDNNVIIIPGIFYNNNLSKVGQDYISSDSYYNIGSINSIQLRENSKNSESINKNLVSININKSEYTKFFNKLFIQGQEIQPGINYIKRNVVKNTPIVRTFVSQTIPKNYNKFLQIFKEMINANSNSKISDNYKNNEHFRFVNEKFLKICNPLDKDEPDYEKIKDSYLKKFKDLVSSDLNGDDFLEMFNQIDTDFTFNFDYFISQQSRDKQPLVKEIIKELKDKFSSKGLFVNI